MSDHSLCSMTHVPFGCSGQALLGYSCAPSPRHVLLETLPQSLGETGNSIELSAACSNNPNCNRHRVRRNTLPGEAQEDVQFIFCEIDSGVVNFGHLLILAV